MKKTLIIISITLVLILLGVVYFLYQNRLSKSEYIDEVQVAEVEREVRLNDVRQRIEQKQVLSDEEYAEHQSKLERIRVLQNQN